MRKYTFLFPAIALLAAGCSRTDIASERPVGSFSIHAQIAEPEPTAEGRGGADEDFVRLPWSDTASRLTIGGEEGLTPLWSADDQIKLFQFSGSTLTATAGSFTLGEGEGTRSGVFTGPAIAAADYVAAYPATATASGNEIRIALPLAQTQSASGNSAHLSAAGAMYSSPLSYGGAGTPYFSFHNACTLLEFAVTVSGGTAGAFPLLQSISIESTDGTKPFAGSISFNKTVTAFSYSDPATAATLKTGTDGHLFAGNGSANAYRGWLALCSSSSHAGKTIAVKVTTDEGTRTFLKKIPAGTGFERGVRYRVSLDIDLTKAFDAAPLDGTETFSTLLDGACFLLGGHSAYKPFKSNQLKVVKVTNLNATGTGSLAWAVTQTGPKIIVFEVGGVINLQGATIKSTQNYTYIAGQTAPSPGITLIRGCLSLRGHDVVVRHIATRTGDNDQPKLSGWEEDGIEVYTAYNVLVDHCSCTWATDENLSVSGPRFDGPDKTARYVTLSNNINAEALCNSTHSKGAHALGTLLHDYTRNIAIVRNLYASNQERNPMVKPNVTAYVTNNLIYNASRRGIHASWSTEEYAGGHEDEMIEAQLSIIGNVSVPGPSSPPNAITSSGFYLIFGRLAAYHTDNVIYKSATDPGGNQSYVISPANQGTIILSTPPLTPTGGPAAMPSTQVVQHVSLNAGSRPKDRDPIDARIISQIATKGGKVIDSQTEVEGYPAYAPTQRTLTPPVNCVERWVESMSKALIE